MSKVPEQVLKQYLNDPFSHECCICGSDRPQLHHNLIYGGRQVNEKWTFIPLCLVHHEMADDRNFRRLLDWVMFNRATRAQLLKYSRAKEYVGKKNWLNSVFGDFSIERLRFLYGTNSYKDISNISK